MSLDLEAQRLQNLQHKAKLLEELNLHSHSHSHSRAPKPINSDSETQKQPLKKRRLNTIAPSLPSRSSARIAASGPRVSYNDDNTGPSPRTDKIRRPHTTTTSRSRSQYQAQALSIPPTPSPPRSSDLPTLLAKYNSWTPSPSTPSPPTQSTDGTGTYHFPSHPTFTPNKSPLSILLEGAFGGSYFSPWHSRTLHLTLQDDHLHTLPENWRSQLHPPTKYLTAAHYDASLNKYAVPCGQSLTEWEAAGWINFSHDPRGWFEWYIRFWLGRRLDDGEDERQVGRWSRCVGPKGRWKRMLLKKYIQAGVRSIFDDDAEERENEVSPVMHQTCHHWAYQVTQEDLDEAWRERGP
ncbi:hypothetical protein LTR99_000583 [Exophiala xenobiotica]|nr:hypothetical protein LTR99_000583 [Exophiala xenobiotica]